MRSDDRHASARDPPVCDLGRQHHSTAAAHLTLYLFAKHQLSGFALTGFQWPHAFEFFLVPFVRLALEWLEPHVLQRKPAQDSRAVQPAVTRLVDGYLRL